MGWAAIIALALLLLKQHAAAPAAAAAAAPVTAADSSGLQSTLGQILSSPAEGTDAPNLAAQQAGSIAINTGVGAATAAGSAAVAGTAVGAAVTSSLLTAGIGAAAVFGVEGLVNLFSCGTLGKIGCQKRHDEATQEAGLKAMRRAMYAVETGQSTITDAANVITATAQQVQAAYQRKASGDNVGVDIDGTAAGIPANSLSGQYLFNTAYPLATITAKFIAFLPVLAAKYAGKPYVLPVPFMGTPKLQGGGDLGPPPPVKVQNVE